MILKKIAPTAIIEEGAKIADNVEIGHFCVIGADVEIGEGTKVHNHVTLAGKTTIGKNNTIFPGAVLGTQPQDLKYAGEQTSSLLGMEISSASLPCSIQAPQAILAKPSSGIITSSWPILTSPMTVS